MLIIPDTLWMRRWDITTMLALVFTAIVTPYEVALLSPTPKTLLFWINRLIDLIFMVDIVVNFHLAYFTVDKELGYHLVKKLPTIRRRYLRGWFWIDLSSILPFDVLKFVMNADALEGLKIVRLIRLLRLLKVCHPSRGRGGGWLAHTDARV